MIKFYLVLCTLSALLQLFLAYQLLTDPEAMIGSFGLPTDDSVAFVARRAGVMFIGLAGLSIAAMMLPGGRAIAALALSIPWLGLALLGSYEHLRGAVGSEAYMAIGIETTLGIALLGLAVALSLRTPAPAL